LLQAPRRGFQGLEKRLEIFPSLGKNKRHFSKPEKGSSRLGIALCCAAGKNENR
jgi:hypothetical protein